MKGGGIFVNIAYGRNRLKVKVPDKYLTAILKMRRVTPVDKIQTNIIDALNNPIGSESLDKLAKDKNTVSVVISDITRPVPNKIILPPLLEYLESSGINNKNILLLVATGAHRRVTHEELIYMLGTEISDKYKIINHNSNDPSQHIYLGNTKNETPIYVNKFYINADLKILTGLIEPHFMAGYSGGRKSICPGICSLNTIKIHHGPKFLESDRATTGILKGNPFHEEALEIAKIAGVDFILNVTLNEKRDVTGIFAGNLEKAHLDGVSFLDKKVRAELEEPVDIVITSGGGYPLDTTYYQTIKGMVAALPIVKEGGTIITISECEEGVGSPEFEKLLRETLDIDMFMQRIWDSDFFVDGQWNLEKLVNVIRKADLFLYSDKLPRQLISELLVSPVVSVETKIKECLKKYGPNSKIAIIPDGPYVFTCLKK